MSTAMVCRDEHLDRDVLIKALRKDVDQKRITDEIAALASVRSKHVVEIYDVIRDKDGRVAAIVEELLSGEDLNSIIPVSDLGTFLKHLYAIACGLADVHAVGRVHRDVKPNNMKFDAEGCLRIYDFGLSRSEDDASTTGTIGTPGYLAPELCVGKQEKAAFTPAIDVFAFGSTAVKLLRGKIPTGLRNVPPTLPCADADFHNQALSLPTAVADVLNACLSVSPKKRPSMADVRDVIGSYLVQWRHKATIVVDEKIYVLDVDNKVVKLSGSDSSAILEYDGTEFIITAVSGIASISNVQCTPPHRLPGSCVLILANGTGSRSFIPIDISYPEVVL
jgi:eukaryotic-like serine/threonine-protein kinase